MKKKAVFILIVIICIATLQAFVSELSSLKNIVLVQLNEVIAGNQLDMLQSYDKTNNSIEYVSLYSRSETSNIKTQRSSLQKATLYKVDENYIKFRNLKMLAGRFIWDSDALKAAKYVVLQKKAAVELFARVDCIGESVFINGEDYKIIGVCEEQGIISGSIAVTDMYMVFIPFTTDKNANSMRDIHAMLKVKPGTSEIAVRSLSNDFSRHASDNLANIKNISITAETGIQKAIFSYYVVVILLLIKLSLIVYKKLKLLILLYANRLDSMYLKEFVLENKRILFINILIIIALTAAWGIVLKAGINYNFVMDPALVPTLDDSSGMLIKYFLKKNNEVNIVSVLSATAQKSNILISYTCLAFIYFSWKIIDVMNRKRPDIHSGGEGKSGNTEYESKTKQKGKHNIDRESNDYTKKNEGGLTL